MADRVPLMSDAELRAALRSYGLPDVPLTATRNIVVRTLVKKMSRRRMPPIRLRENWRAPQEARDSEDSESEEDVSFNAPVRWRYRYEDVSNTTTWWKYGILLGLVYICNHILAAKNTAYMDDKISVIPICHPNIPGNIPGVNCVVSDQVGLTKDLLKMIQPELTTRAEAFRCGNPDALPYLTAREIYDIVNTRIETDFEQIRMLLSNLKVLLEHNPSWGFGVMTLNTTHDGSSILKDMELDSDNVVITINATDRSTPLFCLIFYPLHTANYTLIYTIFFIAVMFTLHGIHKYYMDCHDCYEIYLILKKILRQILREILDSGNHEGREHIFRFADNLSNTLM